MLHDVFVHTTLLCCNFQQFPVIKPITEQLGELFAHQTTSGAVFPVDGYDQMAFPPLHLYYKPRVHLLQKEKCLKIKYVDSAQK